MYKLQYICFTILIIISCSKDFVDEKCSEILCASLSINEAILDWQKLEIELMNNSEDTIGFIFTGYIRQKCDSIMNENHFEFNKLYQDAIIQIKQESYNIQSDDISHIVLPPSFLEF